MIVNAVKNGWEIIFQRNHALSAELKQFLKEQVQWQKQLRHAFSLKKNEMETYYSFLRWCDECSLILCQNRLMNSRQKIEIGNLGNKPSNFIQLVEDNVVQVEPWCFRSSSFQVSAEVYQLNKLKFSSSQALKATIRAAQPETRCWEFKKI